MLSLYGIIWHHFENLLLEPLLIRMCDCITSLHSLCQINLQTYDTSFSMILITEYIDAASLHLKGLCNYTFCYMPRVQR